MKSLPYWQGFMIMTFSLFLGRGIGDIIIEILEDPELVIIQFTFVAFVTFILWTFSELRVRSKKTR